MDAQPSDRASLLPPGTSLRITCDAVYGTGEDAVSLFLIMMRTLPAVPLLSATHLLRPLWHEDLARGLAAALAFEPRQSAALSTFAGPEATVTRRCTSGSRL